MELLREEMVAALFGVIDAQINMKKVIDNGEDPITEVTQFKLLMEEFINVYCFGDTPTKQTELETENQVLRNDLNTALGMLAHWAVGVRLGDKDLSVHYEQVMFKDGPLRSQLDIAIVEAKKQRGK